MPFQRRPQIPVKRPLIVAVDPKAKGVHHTDQFLSLSIARARVNLKQAAGLRIVARLHQITRFFHIRMGRRAPNQQGHTKGIRFADILHTAVFLLLGGANLAHAQVISPDDYIPVDADQARSGQLLFYDKILSGNKNISCGTCHHHDHAGGDGLSLGIGEGGVGVGPERTAGTGEDAIKKRIPRNAPALWNLGHREIDVLFHDGRLTRSAIYGNGFDSPAEEWLPAGLDSLVAAQALFPLIAQFEMAGNPHENEIAGATHDRIDRAWPIIAKRVRTIPAYGDMFVQAFDHIDHPSDVTIVEIGNALGAFIASEWKSFDSPYDQWLTGQSLPNDAERGRQLFVTARCASCHAGPLFTDQQFHALGLPAFGPGRTRQWDQISRDVGRMGETNLIEDAYRFRTPSLRNVALTAPYGHNGAYPTLSAMIRHHADPAAARATWTAQSANLPDVPWLAAVDFAIQQDSAEMSRQAARLDIRPTTLTDADIADLVAFLNALTGETAQARPLGRPSQVPSGLSVD
jgi:cytochrome c peroxidase